MFLDPFLSVVSDEDVTKYLPIYSLTGLVRLSFIRLPKSLMT